MAQNSIIESYKTTRGTLTSRAPGSPVTQVGHSTRPLIHSDQEKCGPFFLSMLMGSWDPSRTCFLVLHLGGSPRPSTLLSDPFAKHAGAVLHPPNPSEPWSALCFAECGGHPTLIWLQTAPAFLPSAVCHTSPGEPPVHCPLPARSSANSCHTSTKVY